MTDERQHDSKHLQVTISGHYMKLTVALWHGVKALGHEIAMC